MTVAPFRASCFVLRTGIFWQQLPQELGYGSGRTCWRRLKEWDSTPVDLVSPIDPADPEHASQL
jgi:hypothetical protein